jgi:hypothetical protein
LVGREYGFRNKDPLQNPVRGRCAIKNEILSLNAGRRVSGDGEYK